MCSSDLGSAPSPDTETRLSVLEDTVCAAAAAMSTLQQMFNCSMLDRNNVQQQEAVSSTPLAIEEPQYSRHLTESVNNEKQRSRRRHRSRSSSQETAPKHRNPDRSRCRARFVDRDGVLSSRDSSMSTKATGRGRSRGRSTATSQRRGRDSSDGSSASEELRSCEELRRRRRHRNHTSSSESSGPQRRRLKPRDFDGSGSFETFMEHFANCAKYNKWRETDKLANLKAALVGDAGQLLWDTAATETDTFSKLVKLLRNRYGGDRQKDKFRMELRLRRRHPGEPLSKLHQDIRRLMALAHPTLTPSERTYRNRPLRRRSGRSRVRSQGP